jgi:hypothetical protein
MHKTSEDTYRRLDINKKRMVHKLIKALADGISTADIETIRRCIRRCSKTDATKRKKNGYILFYTEQYGTVKLEHPDANFGEIAKMVGTLWHEMSDDEKQVYNTRALSE